MTPRFLALRACERLGQTPAWFDALHPVDAAEVVAYELWRSLQDDAERAGAARGR
jgi:hypothetical protein